MNEEFIAKSFLKFLIDKGWEILSYDFPQSGTGISLWPNQTFRQPETKNEGIIIPDIIAFKNGIGLISENKPYFEKRDIDKLEKIREEIYSESLNKVFYGKQVSKLLLGIVIPDIKSETLKAKNYFNKVDFVFTINSNGSCAIDYLLEGIDI